MTLRNPTTEEIDHVLDCSFSSATDVSSSLDRLFDIFPALRDTRSSDRLFFSGISSRLIDGPIVFVTQEWSTSLAILMNSVACARDLSQIGENCPADLISLFGRCGVSNTKSAVQAKNNKASTNIFIDIRCVDINLLPNQFGESFLSRHGRCRVFISGYISDVEEYFRATDIAKGIMWFNEQSTIEFDCDASDMAVVLGALDSATRDYRLITKPEKASRQDLGAIRDRITENLDSMGASCPKVSVDLKGGDLASCAHDILQSIVMSPALSFTSRLILDENSVRALGQLAEYVKCLRRYGTNETTKPLFNSTFPTNSVIPKGMKNWSTYEGYYRFRGREVLHYALPEKLPRYWFSFTPGGYDSGVRIITAASLVEYVISVLRYQNPGECIRWLDVGCGPGEVMNLVDPSRVGVPEFEFIGIDASDGEIRWANWMGGPNRTYLVGDMLSLPQELSSRQFHLVTMFEVLEHVPDPVSLVRAAANLSCGFVLAGSPCDEKVSPLPHGDHLWSFARSGFSTIFRQAELDVVLLNEMRIGLYAGGHDWLSCIGSKGRKLYQAA